MQIANRHRRSFLVVASLVVALHLVLSLNPVWAQNGTGPSRGRANDLGYEIEVVGKAKNSPAYSFVSRALAEYVRRNLKQTIVYADLALRKDSKLAIAYSLRGMAYIELEEPQKAIDDLCKAEAIDPAVGRLRFADMLSRSYIDLQQWEPAIVDINRAISYSPKEPWRYKERAEIYYTCHKYDLALRDFTAAINLAPKAAWLRRTRAECYAGMHKYKEALADYNEVVRLGGADAVTYGCRADIYEKLGQKDLAAKDRALSNHEGFDYIEDKRPAGALIPVRTQPSRHASGH